MGIVKSLVLRTGIRTVVDSLHPVEGVLIVHCPMLLGGVLLLVSLLELLHGIIDLAANVEYAVLHK